MQFEKILAGISDPDTQKRLNTIQILGLVEETEALEPLRTYFQQESDPQVKEALNWAGKRIYAARQRGFNTLEEIFDQYQLNAELENMETPEEVELQQKLEQQFHNQMINEQLTTGTRNKMIGAALGAAIGGASGAIMGASSIGTDMASSSLGNKRPQLGKSRVPAPLPATTPFDIWLRRATGSGAAPEREKAVIEIQRLNNPEAMFPLAEAYINEQNDAVKAAMEKTIRKLYFNTRYHYYDKEGTIDAEFKKRAIAQGKARDHTAPLTEKPEPPKKNKMDAAPGELEKILRDTQELRRLKK